MVRRISLVLLLAFASTAMAQQADKSATRDRAMLLISHAHEASSSLPDGARWRILDQAALLLFQAKVKTGSAALVKEAIAAAGKDAERLRSHPQRDTPDGGFIGSGNMQSVNFAARNAQLHAAIGDTEGARAWIEQAQAEGALLTGDRERMFSISEIARAQTEIGDLDAAQQTLLLIAGTNNSLPMDRIAAIAAARARQGDVAAAKRMTEGQNEATTAAILENIARAQAANKDFSGALETATLIGNSSILKKDHQVEALLAIAEAEDQADDSQAAEATFSVAQQVAAGSSFLLHSIALSKARTGRLQDALQLVSAMPDQAYGGKHMDFMEIAVRAARSHHPEIAREAIRRARAAIEHEPAPDPERFQEAPPEPGRPAIDRKQSELQMLASAQAQSGDMDGAFKTIAALDEGYRGGALYSIAAAQAESGDIAGAEKTLASDSHRHQVPVALAEAKAKAGDFRGAFQLARRSTGNVEQVFRIYCKPEVLATCEAAASEMTSPFSKALALLGMAGNLLGVTPPVDSQWRESNERHAFHAGR